MPIRIPTPLIEFILLGSTEDRRQLQDSPILGDVWLAFGKSPSGRLDLLISPYMTQHAGEVANAVRKGLAKKYKNATNEKNKDADIAYLQGLVAAKLSFQDALDVVVPNTKWWIDKWVEKTPKSRKKGSTARSRTKKVSGTRFTHESMTRYEKSKKRDLLKQMLTVIFGAAKVWHRSLLQEEEEEEQEEVEQRSRAGERGAKDKSVDLVPFDRLAALTGLILWAAEHKAKPASGADSTTYILEAVLTEREIERIATLLRASLKNMKERKAVPLIWQISLNRDALPALVRSVPAVKADAATTLFKVNCSEIGWAVLDSGIDGSHPAFAMRSGKGSRVRRSFDFTNFRRIVSLRNMIKSTRRDVARELTDSSSLKHEFTNKEANDILARLAQDAVSRGPIHWELVEKFVEIKPEAEPATSHGTHVAGIIGANKDAAPRKGVIRKPANGEDIRTNDDWVDGMCPDISLYDFRVLGRNFKQTEFAIIAALQFIRYLNDRDNFFTIHGANLSLSIRHDVRNFACGRTPICNECERLVESGVIVVAAAGNHGYKSFETAEGPYEGYAAFSITDPGNADGVITVGATHRYSPHTYGVSFFSSRGPTGDGRLKPDLVAPGERIHAPFPRGEWGDLDGTSMAAPHVSGAAAMLMARYSELIGRPRRIKQILCDTATDLGRERSFQGNGMLDVLRPFQSI
jgi:serine protease AprX